MALYGKDWGHLLGSKIQTLRQALTSIDVILQVPLNKQGGEIERESLVYVYVIYGQLQFCFTKTLVFCLVKSAGATFSSQIYVHINMALFIHHFMHSGLVQLRLLCGGGKRMSIFLC